MVEHVDEWDGPYPGDEFIGDPEHVDEINVDPNYVEAGYDQGGVLPFTAAKWSGYAPEMRLTGEQLAAHR